jgi:hypothetical protein
LYIDIVPATKAYEPRPYIHITTKDGNNIRLFEGALSAPATEYTARLLRAIWQFHQKGQLFPTWRTDKKGLERPPGDLFDHLIP